MKARASWIGWGSSLCLLVELISSGSNAYIKLNYIICIQICCFSFSTLLYTLVKCLAPLLTRVLYCAMAVRGELREDRMCEGVSGHELP